MAHPNVESLPRWARQLLEARFVRRVTDWFACACHSTSRVSAFDRVAELLEAGQATTKKLTACRAELNRLIERFDVSELRGPITAVMCVCERDGFVTFDMSGPGDAAAKRADRAHASRAQQHDLDRVRELVARGGRPTEHSMLGPLWPLGEPRWKRVAWPSIEELRASDARMWGDDEPPNVYRPASRPLSASVPEVLQELFPSEAFDMVYKAVYETKPSRRRAGHRSLDVSRPRDHKIRLTTPGRHRFRGPGDGRLLRRFCDIVKSGPVSLRFLVSFYRQHDGGLLFKPVKGKAADAHINLYGLEDQGHASALLQYHMEGMEPSGPHFERLCAKMRCEFEDTHCLALIDASFFVVPLAGVYRGRVFRYSPRADRLSEFAPTVEKALHAFAAKICALSGKFGPTHAVGDEAKGAKSELRLVAVNRRSGPRSR